MQVRVKDYLFTEDDEPLLHPDTGVHLKNNLGYVQAKRIYNPGETFELPDDQQKELVSLNGRMVVLELAECQPAREARRIAKLEEGRAQKRDMLALEMAALEQKATAAARMHSLINESELRTLSQGAPGAATAQMLGLLSAALSERSKDVTAAKGEIPPEAQAVIERLQQQAADLAAENARLKEAAAKPRGPKG